jgi:anti-sigma factor RsiW
MDTERRIQISAYLDGELPADERARLEAEIQADPELREELEAMRSLMGELAAMPRETAPDGFLARVMVGVERDADRSEISNESNVIRVPWWRRGPLVSALAASLVLGFGLFAVQTRKDAPPAPAALRAPPAAENLVLPRPTGSLGGGAGGEGTAGDAVADAIAERMRAGSEEPTPLDLAEADTGVAVGAAGAAGGSLAGRARSAGSGLRDVPPGSSGRTSSPSIHVAEFERSDLDESSADPAVLAEAERAAHEQPPAARYAPEPDDEPALLADAGSADEGAGGLGFEEVSIGAFPRRSAETAGSSAAPAAAAAPPAPAAEPAPAKPRPASTVLASLGVADADAVDRLREEIANRGWSVQVLGSAPGPGGQGVDPNTRVLMISAPALSRDELRRTLQRYGALSLGGEMEAGDDGRVRVRVTARW